MYVLVLLSYSVLSVINCLFKTSKWLLPPDSLWHDTQEDGNKEEARPFNFGSTTKHVSTWNYCHPSNGANFQQIRECSAGRVAFGVDWHWRSEHAILCRYYLYTFLENNLEMSCALLNTEL